MIDLQRKFELVPFGRKIAKLKWIDLRAPATDSVGVCSKSTLNYRMFQGNYFLGASGHFENT